MPHKSQKRVHGKDRNIAVEGMKELFGNGKGNSNAARESENETNSEMDTSAFNSSFQSEISDYDQEDIVEQEDEEEMDVNHDLGEFMNFKIVSKDKALIILNHDSKFYFKGKLQVKVLKGKLEILGHTLLPCSLFASVYSPRGYSLLDVHAYKGDTEEDIADKVLSEGVGFDDSKLVIGDCVVVIKKTIETWTKFLQKNLNMKTKLNLLQRDNNIPEEWQNNEEVTKVEKLLDINFLHPANSNSRLFSVGENWDLTLTSVEITQKSGLTPCVLVAGGKGVGKSTFSRWFTNKLLLKSPVVFLDLDPGQAELSIPGYLSVGIVSQPFLGPNFCHVDRKLEMSLYLGDINVANCPGRFNQITRTLIDFVKTDPRFQNLPVVVNTMGWCKGVGLMLVIDTIRYLQPTTLVQLHSRFHRKNYPYSLDHHTVASSRDCWDSTLAHSTRLSYSLLEFLAVPESMPAKDMRAKDYWGLPDPRTTREAVLLSFLGKTCWPYPVYKISLANITLGVLHTKVDPCTLLATMNLALVDLCQVEEKYVRKPENEGLYRVLGNKVPMMLSLGIGLVRNIDMSAGVLYLATCTPTAVLNSVNCLLAGTTKIPDSVLLSNKQKGSPYIANSSSNPLDRSWQRHHKPRGNL